MLVVLMKINSYAADYGGRDCRYTRASRIREKERKREKEIKSSRESLLLWHHLGETLTRAKRQTAVLGASEELK